MCLAVLELKHACSPRLRFWPDLFDFIATYFIMHGGIKNYNDSNINILLIYEDNVECVTKQIRDNFVNNGILIGSPFYNLSNQMMVLPTGSHNRSDILYFTKAMFGHSCSRLIPYCRTTIVVIYPKINLWYFCIKQEWSFDGLHICFCPENTFSAWNARGILFLLYIISRPWTSPGLYGNYYSGGHMFISLHHVEYRHRPPGVEVLMGVITGVWWQFTVIWYGWVSAFFNIIHVLWW